MKLQTKERTIKMSGPFEQTTAVIINNDAMFTLLADKLYRNKIRAAIRELVCNAADSHTESGNDAPFLVTLPNALEPYFKVTDNGLGLVDNDVMNLFQNFGASTRSSTDNVTGGFGLGSKAPYAYVQTFGVVSRFNGKKCTYVCFRNDKGVPSTTRTATEDTDEPNGLQVSFRVEAKDFEEFRTEAAKVLRAFTQPYEVEGANIDIDTEVVEQEGEGWKVIAAEGDGYYARSPESVVRMGNVDYPIPVESIRNLEPVLQRLWESLGIVLELPVGDLSPTPSREDLEVNSEMNDLLADKLSAVRSALLAKFGTQLGEQSNMWDARLKLRELNEDSAFKLLTNGGKQYDAVWKGQPIKDGFDVRYNSDIQIERYERSEKFSKGAYRPCVSTNTVSRYTPREDDVLVLDNLTGTDFKLKNYVRHEMTRDSGRLILIATKTQAKLKEFLKWLGKSQRGLTLATDVDLSDETKARLKELKAANRAARVNSGQDVRRKRGTVRGYRLASSHHPDKESNWEKVDGGVPYKGKKGVYIVISRWEAEPFPGSGLSMSPRGLRECFDVFQKYHWDDVDLIAVKKVDSEKLEKEPGWAHVSTLVPQVHSAVLGSSDWVAAEAHKSSSYHWAHHEQVSHPFWSRCPPYTSKGKLAIIIGLAKNTELATTSTLVTLLKDIPTEHSSAVGREVEYLQQFMPRSAYVQPPQSYYNQETLQERIEKDMYTPLGEIWDKYPMLLAVECSEHIDACIDYIKLVDSQETDNG